MLYVVVGLQPAKAKTYEISGVLNIPSINLISDVTSLELVDHKLDTPDTIVGSYTKYESKIFLVGHSTTVFVDLPAVNLEDAVIYNGEKFRVVSAEVLEKSVIDMNTLLAPEKERTLVIMTCAGEKVGAKDATHRLIVTAVKE